MLQAFGHPGHPVATCCSMLDGANRTSAHAPARQCCADVAKRVQHHATFKNFARCWKKNMIILKLDPTCCNMLQ